MVCLLRLVVLKTERFCLNFILKFQFYIINVSTFLSVCISQFELICILSPFSVVLQLVTKWNSAFWFQKPGDKPLQKVYYSTEILKPHLKRGFLDCWSYLFWTMTSRRPMTRSYSGNGRSGSQNGEDVSSANGRSESRNYLSNVRPENR